MTEEIIIDGELSCNNCLEKTRCKQQQKAKKQRIGAILSYIANKDNEKYIAELKNEIPAITRCDVVLEKQLKRLEQENKELKEENKQHIKEKQILNERLYCYAYEKDCHLVCKQQDCLLKNGYKYRSALEEIKRIIVINKDEFDHCLHHNYDEQILREINEVLNHSEG